MTFRKLLEAKTNYVIAIDDKVLTVQNNKLKFTDNYNFAYTFDTPDEAKQYAKQYSKQIDGDIEIKILNVRKMILESGSDMNESNVSDVIATINDALEDLDDLERNDTIVITFTSMKNNDFYTWYSGGNNLGQVKKALLSIKKAKKFNFVTNSNDGEEVENFAFKDVDDADWDVY